MVNEVSCALIFGPVTKMTGEGGGNGNSQARAEDECAPDAGGEAGSNDEQESCRFR